MGHDAIMCPSNAGLYINFYQGDSKIEPVGIGGRSSMEMVYSYEPVPKVLFENGTAKHIIGVQCNTWAEYRYTVDLLEYMAYPQSLALAENAWVQPEKKNFADFCNRLNNAYVRLDGHNVNYYIPQPEQPFGSCNFVSFTDKAVLEFKPNRPIKMVYTIDGSEPNPKSAEYTQPIELTESTTLKIRSVLPSGKMSPTRLITVEKQALAPAITVENIAPGLKMNVKRGMYLNVDELEKSEEQWEETVVIESLSQITGVVKTSENMRGVKQYAAVAAGYVDIAEDGVYYISSDNEEVWIDGKLLINNRGETKRFSRNDKSLALAKGLHEIKSVFLGHIIGGWPSNWTGGSVNIRKSDVEEFTSIKPDMLFYKQ
jgi:hexosaminidase